MELKFYRCKHCGKIIALVNESKVPTICCDEAMEEIKAGSVDASVEKHVPVVAFEEGKVVVNVGSVTHPMSPEHYIMWIALQTNKGNYIKYLEPTDEPKRCFKICDCEEVKAVYAYCNLHGLWKA